VSEHIHIDNRSAANGVTRSGKIMSLPIGVCSVLVAALPLGETQAGGTRELAQLVELKRTTPISYEKDIEPIFLKRCLACHSGSVKESRLDISSFDQLVKGGKRGAPILAGNPRGSLLYKVLARTAQPHMPPKGEAPITPEELALVKLWIDQGAKAPTGKRERPLIEVREPPATVHPVRGLAISPDSSTIFAGRGNQIHVYDVKTGIQQRSFVQPGLTSGDKPIKAAHVALIESLALSPDGRLLVSGSFQEVVIWDVKTGQLRRRLSGFSHSVVALAFSWDGKMLVTGGGPPGEGGEIRVFEADSWKLTTEIKNGHSDTVYGVAFDPGGKLLATCSADKAVKVFQLSSGRLVKSFEGHTNAVMDVAWQREGQVIVSAGSDNAIRVWDHASGELIRIIDGHEKGVARLQFVGNSFLFVSCGGDHLVKLFNAANGGMVRQFAAANDFLFAVAATADGSLVAAGGQEGSAFVFNGEDGTRITTLAPKSAPFMRP
jgi:WD40 repeat protein